MPAVLAVIGWLDSIARETRRTAGMDGLPIVSVQESFHGRSREEIASATRPVAPAIIDAVTCSQRGKPE